MCLDADRPTPLDDAAPPMKAGPGRPAGRAPAVHRRSAEAARARAFDRTQPTVADARDEPLDALVAA
jgi:hypothetical protein